MSLADKLREEGVQVGIAKGREEGVQVGIAKGEQVGIAKGEQLGIAKGEQVGIAKGERIGRSEERIEVAINMIRNGMDNDLIGRITALPVAEIERLRKTHNVQ